MAPRDLEAMLLGARLFVTIVFGLLGLSFLTTTAMLAHEFGGYGWFDIAAMDSHLFIFFPTLGIVALVAFYLPACVFVDMYWGHVAFGRARFIIGAIVLVLLSWTIATGLLDSKQRSLWEIAPRFLEQDRGEPPDCATVAGPCVRMPVFAAVQNLRSVSQSRLGLREFVRDCAVDRLLDPAGGAERKRFCFAATPLSDNPRLMTDADCCRAQTRLMESVNTLYRSEDRRSMTGRVHALTLPLKVFFLMVLLAISILLALRHGSVDRHYKEHIGRIELGVLVGTVVTLFFPLMSQAFLQSSAALVGSHSKGTFSLMTPMMSFAFGAWTLLILLFFYHRRDKEVEIVGKLGGVMASAVAVVKYDLIVSLFVRALGSGAGWMTMLILLVVCIAAVSLLFISSFSALNRGSAQ
jgi:hypothetical protein